MGRSLVRTLSVLCFFAVVLAAGGLDGAAAKRQKRLLVVTVTKGFRHDSIPTVERVVRELGEQSGAFTVDYARTDEELAAKTTAAGLANYDGVLFAQTTGDIPLADRAAFVAWVKAGHGFAGIHSASDTFHNDAAYLGMIGGEFDHHGEQATVDVRVEDRSSPATKHLDRTFQTHDEIYLFKNFDRANVHMLLALDKHPNTGEPGFFPIAWTREFGKGRVFYTALGHRDDVIESAWYRQHLLGGIRWALGA
jgi:type 1 glutamine amidotransferase